MDMEINPDSPLLQPDSSEPEDFVDVLDDFDIINRIKLIQATASTHGTLPIGEWIERLKALDGWVYDVNNVDFTEEE